MKKWLWRILLGVSSCLLVAICVLWVRSAWVVDHIQGDRTRITAGLSIVDYFDLGSQKGRLGLEVIRESRPVDRLKAVQAEPWRVTWEARPLASTETADEWDWIVTQNKPRWWNRHGFHLDLNHHGLSPQQNWLIGVPHWFLIAIFSLPLLIEIARRYRRRRRKQIGLCQTCGYDLRASVDRCPECGTVIAAVASGGGVRAS